MSTTRSTDTDAHKRSYEKRRESELQRMTNYYLAKAMRLKANRSKERAGTPSYSNFGMALQPNSRKPPCRNMLIAYSTILLDIPCNNSICTLFTGEVEGIYGITCLNESYGLYMFPLFCNFHSFCYEEISSYIFLSYSGTLTLIKLSFYILET